MQQAQHLIIFPHHGHSLVCRSFLLFSVFTVRCNILRFLNSLYFITFTFEVFFFCLFFHSFQRTFPLYMLSFVWGFPALGVSFPLGYRWVSSGSLGALGVCKATSYFIYLAIRCLLFLRLVVCFIFSSHSRYIKWWLYLIFTCDIPNPVHWSSSFSQLYFILFFKDTLQMERSTCT